MFGGFGGLGLGSGIPGFRVRVVGLRVTGSGLGVLLKRIQRITYSV